MPLPIEFHWRLDEQLKVQLSVLDVDVNLLIILKAGFKACVQLRLAVLVVVQEVVRVTQPFFVFIKEPIFWKFRKK